MSHIMFGLIFVEIYKYCCKLRWLTEDVDILIGNIILNNIKCDVLLDFELKQEHHELIDINNYSMKCLYACLT